MIYLLQEMDAISRHEVILQCSNSYLHYHKSLYYQVIVDELMQKTEGKWGNAIRWFVSNSARAYKNNASGITISLHPNYYSKNDAKIGYRAVQSLLKLLECKGYINIYKGYVETWKLSKGKRIPEYTVPSCVIFRERWNQLWDEEDESFGLFDDKEAEPSTEVRSRKTKESLTTRGRIGIKEVREKMDNYNDSLTSANIQYNGKPVATVAYKRVYLDTMNVAGRIYASGGGIQLLPQRLRSELLTIDREPVVELDYHAIHPSLCYSMLAKDGWSVYEVFGEQFDAYGVDLSFIPVDSAAVERHSALIGKKYDPRRNLIKLAVLIGINAVDKQEAVGGLSSKLGEDYKRDVEDRQFVGLIGQGRIPVGKVFDAVLKHNDLIREHFYADRGVLLQKIDSDIMMGVISEMVQKGHTVLCYHDSAVCKKSAEADLREAMENAWIEVVGNNLFCKIEKK